MSKNQVITIKPVTYTYPSLPEFPDIQLVSRETILLAKFLRCNGFDVKFFGEDQGELKYYFQKGMLNSLQDTIFYLTSTVSTNVLVNLATNFIERFLRRTPLLGNNC